MAVLTSEYEFDLLLVLIIMVTPTSTNQVYQVKTLINVIEQIDSFGLTSQQIYEGTELSFAKLRNNQADISKADQYQIFRNIQKYTRDPLIGLKIGSLVRIEHLGVLGFATLSANTREEALAVFSEYYELAGSDFRFEQQTVSNRLYISFSPCVDIPDDLKSAYFDLQAAGLAFSEGSREETEKYLKEVRLMHQQYHLKAAYEAFFGCPVSFNQPTNTLVFDPAFAELPMPRSDSETSRLCQEECRRAIAELHNRRPIHHKVREVILQKTGYFPNITEVSKQLVIPERTLRRKLDNEGTSYKKLLAEIRFGLAKEYLSTDLAIEKIAELTGYSEAANFSHAFKRWAGVSPRQYRQLFRQGKNNDEGTNNDAQPQSRKIPEASQ